MKLFVKWAAEGAVKGFGRVFCDVWAYVSCRGYAGIPPSARLRRESRWHRGSSDSPLTGQRILSGAFFFSLQILSPIFILEGLRMLLTKRWRPLR